MNDTADHRFERLEAAIAAWNSKIGGGYQELLESLALTRRKIEVVQRVLGARRTLSPTLVVAKMKMDAVQQTPEERAAVVDAALSRLQLLDRTLTSYHVELRTLHAQAGRAVAAGDVLAEELLLLQDSREAAALVSGGEGPSEGDVPDGAGAAEDELAVRMSSMRIENTQLREQLKKEESELARLRAKQSTADLRDTELAALRSELGHVREQLKQAQTLPKPTPETEMEHAVKESELEALRVELSHVRTQLEETRQRAEKAQSSVSDRERKLTSRIETLRRELLRVREQMASTDQRARQTVLTAEKQQELAEVRMQVDALQLEGVDAMRRPGEDPESVFERICEHAFDTTGNRRPMGKILVDAGVITAEELESALREQQTAWNRHLGGILVDLGFTSEGTIAQTLAAQIRAPFVQLSEESVQPEALALVSGSLAHHHSCVPLRLQADRLLVAMANPFDLVALEDLQLAAGRTIEPVVSPADEIKSALRRYYPQFVRV